MTTSEAQFTRRTFYPPGSDSEMSPASGMVAQSPEQASHLEAAGWITADAYFAPSREREAQQRERAAKAAAVAQRQAEQLEKQLRAQREKQEAERKLKAEADAAAAQLAAEREARDTFHVKVYKAQLQPLEERRGRIRDQLSRIAGQLSQGWDSDLAIQGVDLEAELETIAQRVAEAEQQLADARAEEQKRWRNK